MEGGWWHVATVCLGLLPLVLSVRLYISCIASRLNLGPGLSCSCGFPPVTPAFSHRPKTASGVVLIGDSKLSTGVNISVSVSWDRLLPPFRD